ncbi:MAG: CoA transferase [Betaproteobacteria bacterium]|nr:CoA transferase [Betaproteobacteria bacterium]
MSQPLPLEGIRVVEFSHMVMGPSCGLVLADLGAEVIKVEPAGKGDPTRYLTSTGAGFFASFNRNKKSVTLDLASPEGIATAKKLVATADVFIENFRPGALEAKGLGYAALSAANPRLVYCSLKGFLTGPYEKRTALDEVVQMMSGLAYMTGPVGRPLRAGAPVNDMMGGMFGAIAILAALRDRDRTGQGQLVQGGLFENAAWLVSTHMMQEAVLGKPPIPMSAGKRAWGVYDIFTTADGKSLFVGVVTERQWELFTDALGEDVLRDPAYATNNDRSRARETLIPLVQTILGRRDCATIEAMCEKAGLPFARVQTPSDLFDDPHLNAGGMIEQSLPDGRTTHIPALPVQFGDARLALRLPLPKPGEHNLEILGPLA